jgi:3-hydroxymyristoyl/3-hydroxydecanoyl-(acyl carrier protein) dehydratase
VWRFVAALPRDVQDKIPLAELQRLFEGPDASGRPTSPDIVDESRSADFFERRLDVSRDLAQLEGHFDSFPVVAGVVQLDWALRAAADWLGVPPRLAGLEALKFPQPLVPGSRVTLRLERTATAGFRFRIFDGQRTFATGRAVLAADPSLPGNA